MSEYVTRRRALRSLSGTSRWQRTPPSGSVINATTSFELPAGRQVTVSKGNPFHSSRKEGKGLTDIGGDFFTQKSYIASSHKERRIIGASGGVEIPGRNVNIGYSIARPLNWTSFAMYPPASVSSDDDMDELGATAIAACNPTNAVADASTFLGELLKEGLPSLVGSQTWKSRTLSAKNAGSEYLNVQFGWRPIVSEVKKFSYLVSHADSVLAQFERDSGRVVRRRFEFPVERSVVETTANQGSNVPLGHAGSMGIYGTVHRRRETIRRKWFSGAFTYHIPSGYNSRTAMGKYALLADRAGLSLTPDTLWNLAPWSWAIDWFSNTGDVLSNISSFTQYGLILRYGYVMEHTTVRDTYSQRGSSFPVDDLILVTETKKRRQANPFGFGVSWSGLNSFQLSIMAALGISKRGR